MSQLKVSAQGQQDFYLNVLSFDSPVFGEMNSGQARSAIQYYPIKAYQPELSCDVIFPSEVIWQAWQIWSRQNMINAQTAGVSNGSVTLNWPERNINNWTGIICATKAGGRRANYAPRTTVQFQLVVSLVSTVGTFSAVANAISSLTSGSVSGAGSGSSIGGGSNGGVMVQPLATGALLGGGIPGVSGISGLLGGSSTGGGAGGLGGLTSLTSGLGSLTGAFGSLTSLTSLIPGLSSVTGILGGL